MYQEVEIMKKNWYELILFGILAVSVRLNQPMGGADIFLDRISSFVLTLYDEFSEFFCLN